mmetsp:Transcript_29991/g.45695  ORF Transcript_29991/g.45695 Transcript_29991/m.45695 type:complete len:545 (+) Transcript_29991:128-1762(+)
MGNSSSEQITSEPPEGTLNNNLLRHRGGDVTKKYVILQEIGMGSMGAISRAKIRASQVGGSAYNTSQVGCGCLGFNVKQKTTTEVDHKPRKNQVYYALKTIMISRVSPDFIEELRNEIEILKTLDHPNIVRAFEVFDNKSQIYIVMELCSGGDLYRRLPYSEQQAASIAGKLCSAIAYMHAKSVVHRDLKFENIMWENDTSDEVKIIDFGLSKKFLPNESNRTMTEGVGTIYTMAPQVLQGVYTSQADLWSIGVIAFMLLSSQKPFHNKRRRKVIDMIMRCDYKFQGEIWNLVSSDAKDFVSKLLVLDPRKRMDANQARKHQWFANAYNLSDRRPTESLMQKVEDNLLGFKETSKLKQLALNVIARKSTPDEIYQLRKAFNQFDVENDGIVTYAEFKAALKESDYSEEELEEIFKSIDVNKNGHIVYTEFIAASLEAKGMIEEDRIAEAFDRMDADSSGFISPEDLARLLGNGYTEQEIKSIIAQVDENKDGKISFDEFKIIFQLHTSKRKSELFHEQSNLSSMDEGSLMGLDAKIPGGKHDKE